MVGRAGVGKNTLRARANPLVFRPPSVLAHPKPSILLTWRHPGCVRLATVRATKVSISRTLPRWKKPNDDRSAPKPSRGGSPSPAHLSTATAVRRIGVEA